MPQKNYHGSCKCKKVTFEAKFDLAEGTNKCNCTSCFKRRLWTVRVLPANFRATGGVENMHDTPAGSDKGSGFCKDCGVITYGWVPKSDWNEAEYVSVSVAAIDDFDFNELATAPTRFMDGLHDNWWNPPQETRYL